jgi:hypothetical protein
MKSHIIGSAGAMRKVSERDIDRQIERNREAYASACCGDCRQGHAACESPDTCVIDTDHHWPSRLVRWIEGTYRVLLMRLRVWNACRKTPPF